MPIASDVGKVRCAAFYTRLTKPQYWPWQCEPEYGWWVGWREPSAMPPNKLMALGYSGRAFRRERDALGAIKSLEAAGITPEVLAAHDNCDLKFWSGLDAVIASGLIW